jgi:hypothetical protein
MSTDLEAAESQEAAEVAFAIEGRIKKAMADGRKALWELAEALYEFDEEHGWMALGHETLSDWLADPEVTMTMGTYRRYVRTWRKLVIEKQIEPDRIRRLEQSKVAIVVDKIASNEVLVDDALADVDSLGARDLREKYYSRREPEPEPEPEPEASNVGQSDVEVEPVSGEMVAAMAGIKLPPYAGMVDVEVVAGRVIEGTATDVVAEAPLTGEDIAAIDAAVAERRAAFAGYEFPGWITRGSVQSCLGDLASGVDSGAGFPRVSRRAAQVALELAQAWLTTNPD